MREAGCAREKKDNPKSRSGNTKKTVKTSLEGSTSIQCLDHLVNLSKTFDVLVCLGGLERLNQRCGLEMSSIGQKIIHAVYVLPSGAHLPAATGRNLPHPFLA
jgi:hypothetical protein